MENELENDLKELVVERLKTLPKGTRISIGSDGSFSTQDLIDHISKGDSIGNKIVEIQLNYLRLLKTGTLLDE
jgi:hypothetical protein